MANGNSDFYTPALAEPQQPTLPKPHEPDYYALPQAKDRPGDYYTTFPDTTAPADATSTLGILQGPHPPFAAQHPIINALIVQPVKEVASYVKNMLTGDLLAFTLAPYEYAQEHGGDEAKALELQDAQRGAALVASFLPAGRAVKLAGALKFGPVAKAAAFLGGEFTGGAIYGAVEPEQLGKTKTEQILGEGALFAGTAGVFAGGAKMLAGAYRKFILSNLGTKGVELAVAKLAEAKAALAKAGTTMDALPPQVRDEILRNVYQETTEELAPDLSKVEGLIRNEIAGASGASPARVSVKSILPDPNEAYAFAEPMEVPYGLTRTEVPDVPSPRLVDEAGKPTRMYHGTTEVFSDLDPTATQTGNLYFSTDPKVANWMADVPEGIAPRVYPAYLNIQKPLNLDHPPAGFREAVVKELGLTKESALGNVHLADDLGRMTQIGRELGERGGFFEADIRKIAQRMGYDGLTFIDRYGPLQFEKSRTWIVFSKEQVQSAPSALEESVTSLIAPPQGLEPTAVEGKFRPRRKAPKGFEPTGIPPEALADVAVRDAVARTEPLEVATQEVKAAASEVKQDELRGLTDEELAARGPLGSTPPREASGLAQPGVPEPLPSSYIERERRRAQVPVAEERRAGFPKVPEPLTQVAAPWAEREAPVATPALDALETSVRMVDSELETLQREFMRIAHAEPEAPSTLDVVKEEMRKIGSAEAEFAREYAKRKGLGEAGAAAQAVIGRLLLAGAGAGILVKSGDDKLDPGRRSIYWAIGGMLVAASMLRTGFAREQLLKAKPTGIALADWMHQFIRKFMFNANPAYMMKSAGSKEGARRYVEAITWSKELGYGHKRALEEIFDKENWRSAQISSDEMNAAAGTFPAEFHQLSPLQQRGAVAVNQFNARLEQILHHEGIADEYIDNYAQRVLPSETYLRWRQQGFKVDPASGERVRIKTLREFEDFAAANALPPPVVRFPDIQALRITEAYRAIGNVRMRKEMARLWLIVDAPKVVTDPMPEGWRTLRILGMSNKIAPEAVAHALENISSPVASRSDLLNAADKLKTFWMRAIMLFAWEHGANVLRAIPSAATNPVGFARAWAAVWRNDPTLLEAASHGLNLRARADYGLRSAKAFEELVQRTGGIPVIGTMVRTGGYLVEKQERFLWDQLVPSLQLFAYQNEMQRWASRTGGEFLPGSVEYIGAARKAADFANTVSGRIPTELANPQLIQLMRLAMFSPAWTTSRIALSVGAMGELSEIASGRLNPLHSAYLPAKIRQVATAVALTYVGSKILSGKAPEFNPKTGKFYMRTGLRNETGREVGLDLAGWWQDDIKLLNKPFDYLLGRLNPSLKVAGETITGRDFSGRDMTYPQRLVNILQSLGPPAEAANLAARALTPGPRITSGELASRASGVLAVGNVSALPRPMDAAIARYSEKLLKRVGLPANDYMVFELSRLLRGNLLSGQSLIDNRVITYLAYRRRSQAVREPISGATQWLWQEARRTLADF